MKRAFLLPRFLSLILSVCLALPPGPTRPMAGAGSPAFALRGIQATQSGLEEDVAEALGGQPLPSEPRTEIPGAGLEEGKAEADPIQERLGHREDYNEGEYWWWWDYESGGTPLPEIPQSGYKLYITGEPEETGELLDLVLPFLRGRRIPHKVMKSAHLLRLSRSPEAPDNLKKEEGKFIVVYPPLPVGEKGRMSKLARELNPDGFVLSEASVQAAAKLAIALDDLAAGANLPKRPKPISLVMSLPEGRSGRLFVRYGGFAGDSYYGPHPDFPGEVVVYEDIRDRANAFPQWLGSEAEDPFLRAVTQEKAGTGFRGDTLPKGAGLEEWEIRENPRHPFPEGLDEDARREIFDRILQVAIAQTGGYPTQVVLANVVQKLKGYLASPQHVSLRTEEHGLLEVIQEHPDLQDSIFDAIANASVIQGPGVEEEGNLKTIVEDQHFPFMASDEKLGKVFNTKSLLEQLKSMGQDTRAIVQVLAREVAEIDHAGFGRHGEELQDWQVSSWEGPLETGFVYVLINNAGKVTGFIKGGVHDGSAFLQKLATKKEEGVKRKGYLLLDAYLDDVKGQGIGAVYWVALNENATSYYKRYLDLREFQYEFKPIVEPEADLESPQEFERATDFVVKLDPSWIAAGPAVAQMRRRIQTLFIVEDDEENQRLLVRYFRKFRPWLRIFLAPSYKEAQEKWKSQKADAVITDWDLRDGFGDDLIERVINPPDRRVTVPIIMISGTREPSDQIRRLLDDEEGRLLLYESKLDIDHGWIERALNTFDEKMVLASQPAPDPEGAGLSAMEPGGPATNSGGEEGTGLEEVEIRENPRHPFPEGLDEDARREIFHKILQVANRLTGGYPHQVVLADVVRKLRGYLASPQEVYLRTDERDLLKVIQQEHPDLQGEIFDAIAHASIKRWGSWEKIDWEAEDQWYQFPPGQLTLAQIESALSRALPDHREHGLQVIMPKQGNPFLVLIIGGHLQFRPIPGSRFEWGGKVVDRIHAHLRYEFPSGLDFEMREKTYQWEGSFHTPHTSSREVPDRDFVYTPTGHLIEYGIGPRNRPQGIKIKIKRDGENKPKIRVLFETESYHLHEERNSILRYWQWSPDRKTRILRHSSSTLTDYFFRVVGRPGVTQVEMVDEFGDWVRWDRSVTVRSLFGSMAKKTKESGPDTRPERPKRSEGAGLEEDEEEEIRRIAEQIRVVKMSPQMNPAEIQGEEVEDTLQVIREIEGQAILRSERPYLLHHKEQQYLGRRYREFGHLDSCVSASIANALRALNLFPAGATEKDLLDQLDDNSFKFSSPLNAHVVRDDAIEQLAAIYHAKVDPSLLPGANTVKPFIEHLANGGVAVAIQGRHAITVSRIDRVGTQLHLWIHDPLRSDPYTLPLEEYFPWLVRLRMTPDQEGGTLIFLLQRETPEKPIQITGLVEHTKGTGLEEMGRGDFMAKAGTGFRGDTLPEGTGLSATKLGGPATNSGGEEGVEAWKGVAATPAYAGVEEGILPILLPDANHVAPLLAKGNQFFVVLADSQGGLEEIRTLLDAVGAEPAGYQLRLIRGSISAAVEAVARDFPNSHPYLVDRNRISELLAGLEEEGVIPIGDYIEALQATQRSLRRAA